MSTGQYVVVVDFTVSPESRDGFEQLIAANARQSLADEIGCERFDVCRAPDDPTRFLLYEIYADRAAFDAHLQTPHFRGFDTASAPMVTSKQVRVFEMVMAVG